MHSRFRDGSDYVITSFVGLLRALLLMGAQPLTGCYVWQTMWIPGITHQMIVIAPTAHISKLADIEDSVRGSRIEIGNSVVIDSFVKIKPAGGIGDVYIGDFSIINSGCVLYTGNGITLGTGVAVAANCTFAPTNHEYRRANVSIRQQGFAASRGGIVVGNDVWIGANCVLLDGAHIGDGCVIGAGTVVRGHLDAYGVYAGNPIKKVGMRQ